MDRHNINLVNHKKILKDILDSFDGEDEEYQKSEI